MHMLTSDIHARALVASSTLWINSFVRHRWASRNGSFTCAYMSVQHAIYIAFCLPDSNSGPQLTMTVVALHIIWESHCNRMTSFCMTCGRSLLATLGHANTANIDMIVCETSVTYVHENDQCLLCACQEIQTQKCVASSRLDHVHKYTKHNSSETK